jgi:hypothetical protein
MSVSVIDTALRRQWQFVRRLELDSDLNRSGAPGDTVTFAIAFSV